MASTTAQAAQETARLGISTAVEGLATGIIEIGAATPVVAPLCLALLKVKGIVDGASRNKEEMKELCERCALITKQVIVTAKTSNTSIIDVSPLQECIDKLGELAERFHDQGRLARLARFRRDGDDIQKLRARIKAVVPIMNLAGVVNIGKEIDQARPQPRPKLAPVPTKVPVTKSLHVVRDGVVDRVCKILGGDGGPALAALMGRSGAGKTTSAAAMVGKRGDRVRALFPDGVVWLRVGKGAGAADRLPRLMHKLAKRLHADVMQEGVDLPEAGEEGGSYVKKIVSQEMLRCLVVADDVWEREVVQKLRETGMWVLLTTREASMIDVEANERVVVDTLTMAEAEEVLRGAAELAPGGRLCNAAEDLLKICGRVAMDTAFAGSWICHVETKRKEDEWARAVEKIKAQGGGVDVERANNRRAILRAGFKYPGTEIVLAQELYAELAVFPDGYAFVESDAAVLLGNWEVATKPISILERWGVLKADASDKYRMHDAHMESGKEELMGSDKIRKPAVKRWTDHISSLDVAVGVDVYALLGMWRALEEVRGEGWWALRPYDDEFVQMDVSNPSNILAVRVVAEIYYHHRKFGELEELLGKVLERCDVHKGDCLQVEMSALTALYYTRNAFGWQGRHRGREDIVRRLGELCDPDLQLPRPSDGNDVLQTSTTFSMYGVCAKAAGRMEDAEELFRKAFTAQETGGLTASYQAVFVTVELGYCAQEAGRFKEAESWLKRALEIEEVKLGPDDLQIALTLRDLGWCLRQAGKFGEAEPFFRRALEIEEAKLGPDATTLHRLGLCVLEAGKFGEAEALFQRALKVKEAKLGPDDVGVAVTLHCLGRCVLEAGRFGEAEPFFRRALEIGQAKLGPDDVGNAYTMHELGQCVLEAGKLGEAEALFQRALKVKEAKLGPDDVGVAVTLHCLGRCVLEAGKLGEAEALFQRALKVKEAKLGPDDVGVAVALHCLGRCVLEAGKFGKAEVLFRRALEIGQAKLGPDDVGNAYTMHELGRCALEAGKFGEAEALFRQALEIEEAKLGPDDIQLAYTLHRLGLCVLEAGKFGEAEALFQRALKVKEAKLGPDDVGIAATLQEMGLCAREAGRPGEAEALFRRALEIKEAKLGGVHADIVAIRLKPGRCIEDAGGLAETE